jgi:hypothetical protein
MHLFEVLAQLLPMGSMPAESLIELERHELVYGTTVVLVTSVTSDRLIQQLLQLRRAGHQPVLLLITAEEQPLVALEGLPAYAIRIQDTQ